ncbi:hypothetical protein KAFR_0B00290 [Kazachstania africana CBS 2517]|uniref:Autophagy-related protein 13 n=1 Tax=Kazachstania africana (strain ATCC 22294 / BCRC 22015 / CBS 2517 / CECT 1963 / NBRC 1671 / NRRL Y-8276) TaxID=1071382 RepID=H2APM9_KAZAF|nr:hypothetical protein KAFR_0B00290 [Kazachstania africana CBS 2517]CCF56329.1 hypothetical protein KAFR_0B00290 [Kazachstania africana CBS 2517]
MPTSSSDCDILKIIDNFFLKSTLLICSSVSSNVLQDSPKISDEWFRSDESSTYFLPDLINNWLHFDGGKVLAPLVVETFLDLRGLPASYIVRLKDNDENLWNVCKGSKKTEIMLERWLIELDNSSTTFQSCQVEDDEEHNIQRQLVLLLRYIYTLIHILPVHELCASINAQLNSQTNISRPMPSVGTRIVDGSKPILSKGRIGLSKPIINSYSNVLNESNIPSHLDQKKITPVWTEYGLLRVSISYRKDCKFEIEDTESNTIISAPTNRKSISLSPKARPNLGFSSTESNHQFLQKHPMSISRQAQPFKIGSVNSVLQSTSQVPSRNPSTSSVLGTLYPRKSSISSNYGPMTKPSVEGTSVDSNSSRFLTSYGTLRRQSSINRMNDNKSNIKSNQLLEESNDDLLNFVKLIDEKPEITFKRDRDASNNTNSLNNEMISNSILKFQNLKPSNDLLSEDLSQSVTLDTSKHGISQTQAIPIVNSTQKRRSRSRSQSHSHSPTISFSSPPLYPSINSKLYANEQTTVEASNSGSSSRRNSTERSAMHFMPPILAGQTYSYTVNNHNGAEDIIHENEEHEAKLAEENSDLDESLANFQSSSWKASPRSFENISRSFPANKIQPYGQSYNYSKPTAMSIPAHAELHKPSVQSTDLLIDEANKSTSPVDDDNSQKNRKDQRESDDDELVFFMSNMSLSK